VGIASLKPLPYAGLVLAVIVVFLGLDSGASPGGQLLLGAATWSALIWSCAGLTPVERARVTLVVVAASAAEVMGSIVLGAYVYRLHNLPAFVPPGHGLVYLAGLRISQSGVVRRHGALFVRAAIAMAASWALAGLFVLGRTDLLGALTGAGLIYMLARGRTASLYAGVFLVVAFLELYGTAIGAWRWSGAVPGTPPTPPRCACRAPR
jgi:hypothetical protein